MSRDGILLVDKPEGISSFKVCRSVRKTTGIKRVGHGGTLDPMATGLLIVLVGKATRLFDSLLAGRKRYQGVIHLGEARDTQDKTGQTTHQTKEEFVREALIGQNIEKVRRSLLGKQIQTAPIFSALKHKGKPLYHYARKNIKVEPKKREIEVFSFNVKKNSDLELFFEAEVSKGTYLRALADEFGRRLGTFGYLSSLRRTQSGEFNIQNAVSFKEIEKSSRDEVLGHLFQPEETLNQS